MSLTLTPPKITPSKHSSDTDDHAQFDHDDQPPTDGSDSDDVDRGPYSFDRRRSPRWDAYGSATAFILDGESFGRMHTLQLTDAAQDGIGADSNDAISPGTMVSLGFEDPGQIAQQGVVVRCLPTGDGYRVGILFQRRLAA